MRLKREYSYILQNKLRLNKTAKHLFLLPGLSGVAFFVLIPFGDVILRSFRTALSGRFVGLQNYQSVYGNAAFRLAAVNTVRFVSVCIPLLLLISLVLALMINGTSKWGKYKNLYLLPMSVPTATMVLVWKMIFSRQGFLNRMIGAHVDFMGENSAFFILVGTYLWRNLGYTLILWIAGLNAIPGDIPDAAKVDGAGRIQRFLWVILPNLKGSMYTITVLSLLNSFKVFREVYLISGSYPQEKIYLLPHVFNNWYTNLDLDKMAAGAVLSALILGSISLLLQRHWNKEDS